MQVPQSELKPGHWAYSKNLNEWFKVLGVIGDAVILEDDRGVENTNTVSLARCIRNGVVFQDEKKVKLNLGEIAEKFNLKPDEIELDLPEAKVKPVEKSVEIASARVILITAMRMVNSKKHGGNLSRGEKIKFRRFLGRIEKSLDA